MELNKKNQSLIFFCFFAYILIFQDFHEQKQKKKVFFGMQIYIYFLIK